LLSSLSPATGTPAEAMVIQRAPVDERDVGGVVDSLRVAIRRDIFRRRIEVNFEKAEAALAGLTHEQGQLVKTLWLEKDGHPLPELLFGQDDLFPGTSLRPDQFKELANLLGGTRAGDASELGDAAERSVIIEAAKLHDGLRQGDSGKEAVFTALAALNLGTGKKARAALESVYVKHFRTVVVMDLNSFLFGRDLQRALALFTGDTSGAEALAIEQQVEVKRGLERPTTVADVINRQDRQHKADAAIEEHLANLRAAGGGEMKKALASPSGHGTLGSELDTVSHGDAAAVQHALAETDESRLVAARLARLHHEGKLTAADIERELTGLRSAIARQVHQDGRGQALAPRLKTAFAELEFVFIAQTQQSLRYVISITGSKGPRLVGFGDAKVALEPEAEQERNAELLRGFGQIVDEDRAQLFGPPIHISAAIVKLDLAVRERDVARIREALAGRTKKQVEELAKDYQAYTHRELKTDLLGSPEMQQAARMIPGAFDNEKLAEKAEILEGDTFESSDPWAGKDSVQAHREEAGWIYRRICSLYDRVVENRGLFAQLRDWGGNIEKTVVDDARKAADGAYWALLADARRSNVEKHLETLRKCQARLEHNVEVYKEATKEAFDEFVDAAVFVVTSALTLGEGGAVFMAWRTILGTVGTKFMLKQEDYSLNELRNDIFEGVAGAVGSEAAKRALDELIPVIAKVAEDQFAKTKVKLPEWAKGAAEHAKAATEHTVHFAGEQGGSVVATGAVTGKDPKFGELEQEGVKDILRVLVKKAKEGPTKPTESAASEHHEGAEGKAGGEASSAERANVIELPEAPHPVANAPTLKPAPDFDVAEHLVGDCALQGGYKESVLKKLAIENWEKGGGNQLVKVVSAERGASKEVGGYVTELKYVRGRNLAEIEQVLGLPAGELANGAIVHTLDGVPSADQFQLKAYTQLPEGKTFHVPGRYPPGLGAPQWMLTASLPVAKVTTVGPKQRYRP
jgi:hypothetical protein